MMNLSGFELDILVKNKPITKYTHEGDTFVEGRNGSEYIIRVRNDTFKKAEAIISVDGLSVLNGEEASDSSIGYLILPSSTIDIPCWKINGSEGAKFCFGTKESSYSAQIGKGISNTGVIGVRVFFEKRTPVYRTPYINNLDYWSYHNIDQAWPTRATAKYNSARSLGAIQASCNNDVFSSTNACGSNSVEEKGLGTSFGESMSWNTVEVAFQRDLSSGGVLTIYYDTRKNLEKMGIRIKPSKGDLPNAFPGNTGCPIPPNWRK